MKHLLSLLVVFASFLAWAQPPTAHITSPDPIICSGESVTLSSSTSTPGGSPIVSSIWSVTSAGCGTFTFTGNPFVLPLTCAGTYSVSLIVQDQNGNAGADQIADFVVVNQVPTADIAAAVNSCTPPLAVTYGIGSSSQGPGITYAWTFENGTPPTFTGANPPTINYNTPGNYDVQMIVTSTTTGCKDTAFRTMVVSDFDAGITAPATACEGEVIQLTDASTIGVNQWNWTMPGGSPSSSSAQDPTVSYAVAGTYTISLSSSNTSVGCNGSTTRQITILPNPTPSFTATPLVGCAPLGVTFTNTTGASGTFTWNFGDGTANFTGQTPPIHMYAGNGSFTPTLTMVGTNGCSAVFTGATINLTSPVANFTITENTLCEPKNVTFTDASTAPAPGIESWEWVFDDGSANVINFTNASVNHDYMCGIYHPSLIIAMSNGCRDTVQAGEIKVGTTLDVGFTVDPILECIKKPIELVSTTVIDCPHTDADLIYMWEFEDAPEPGDSVKTKTFPDTMQNVGYATDVNLEINFRGCKSRLDSTDVIYIKAPVSRFSLDNMLFCNVGQFGPNLTFPITVNVDDSQSVYGHIGNITHDGTLIPDQSVDDVVLTYRWDDGTPDYVIENDALVEDGNKGDTLHQFTDYGTYTVTQVIENRTTGCIDSTSRVVNISWVQTAFDFDIAGPDSVCLGSPVSFTETSSGHGFPTTVSEPHTPLSFSFAMGDPVSTSPVTGQSGANPTTSYNFTYTTAGDYNVVLTTTNSVGCVDTHTDHITVFALPQAVLTSSVPLTGCVGVTLTADFINGSVHPPGSFGFGNDNSGWASSNAFNWTFSNGDPSPTAVTNLRSDQLTSSMNGPNTITLQATDGFGCVSPIVSLSSTIQQPQAAINIPSTVCNQTSGLISAVGNFTSFIWTVDGIQSPQTPVGSIPYSFNLPESTLSETHTYGLIVFDALGCSDTLSNQTITVSNPRADFTDVQFGSSVDAQGNFLCPPVRVDFTDASQSVTNITNWVWILETFAQTGPASLNPTSTDQSPQGIQYLFAGTYDLTLIIQDAAGCIDSLVIIDYLTIQGPSGDPSITTNAGICGQDFTFNLTNTNNVSSWDWNLGDGTTVSSSAEPDNNFVHGYSDVTTYYPIITLYDAVGCAVPYRDTIVISPNGVNAFFTADPSTDIDLGTVVTFDESSSSVSGNLLTWIWNFGDGRIDTVSNGNNITNQYFVGGDVPVTLTVIDDRGCTDQYTVLLTIDVDFVMPNVFTGFGSPGPNHDLLLFADVFKEFEILIVNRWGNVVYEGTRDPANPRYLWNGIDQKSSKLCSEGTYFYKMKGVLKNDVEVNIHGFVTLIATTPQ